MKPYGVSWDSVWNNDFWSFFCTLRWIKQSKKGLRYKSLKKMSCGHMSTRLTEERPKLKKRPKSMVTMLPSQKSLLTDPDLITHQHHRSNTVSGGKPPKHKPGRRGSRQKSPASGNHSPLHGADEPRQKKKKNDKKRKQDRAQKHSATKENLGSSVLSLNPPQTPADVLPLLEEKDEEEKQKKATILSTSPSHSEYSDISSVGHIDVTASLRGHSGSFTSRHDRRLSAADLESIRRARSDAHLLNFGRMNGEGREERHHVCPPERKQFYRQILKRINAGTRHRIEPAQGGMQHISRLRSENLALGNPFGPMWERIWQEIQTYLGDMTQEEYDQFKYKIGEQVEAIISRVMKFKVGSLDALFKDGSCLDQSRGHHSAENMMQAVARKLTYSAESAVELHSLGRESSGTLVEWEGDEERQPSSDGRRCRFNIDTSTTTGSGTRVAGPCVTTGLDAANRSAPDTVCASIASTTCKSSKSKYCFNQFLSEDQLSALDEVDGLLDEMYTLESRYPNRKRLGDEHPRYNEVSFKVRHIALVLWFKITTSLADKLCSLSVWLETPVVIPDICREISGSEAGHMTIGEAGDVLSDLGSPQLSPKSPRVTRRFTLGTSDSGSENTPCSSLKQSHGFPRSDAIDVTKSIMSPFLGPGTSGIDVTKSLLLDQNAGPYRDFVNRGLKRKGLTYTVQVQCMYMHM